MKIDCPDCAGSGVTLVSGKGSVPCSYCKGLGSVGLVVHSKKDVIICHICGKQVYDKPYQFLLKGFEEQVFYAHRFTNEDGLKCKEKLDEAKRVKNFRLLPD